MLSSFVSAVSVISALCPWPRTLIYNGHDCRDFEVIEFESANFLHHIAIGSSENMPPQLHDLTGIWYLYGNEYASTKLTSFAFTQVVDGGNAFEFKTYQSKATAFSDEGAFHQLLRLGGVSYTIKKTSNSTYRIHPKVHLPPLLLSLEFEVPNYIATFDLFKTNDPDRLIRASTVFSKEASPYEMLRIVNANGTYTSKYYSHYINSVPPTLVTVTEIHM